jgi:hypothetical protein
VRTTSGSATSACATGTSSGESAQAQRRPVQGDEEAEAQGDRRDAERQHEEAVERAAEPALAPVSERRLTTTAIEPPRSSDIQVASTAVRSEVTSASVTGTSSALPGADVVQRAVVARLHASRRAATRRRRVRIGAATRRAPAR